MTMTSEHPWSVLHPDWPLGYPGEPGLADIDVLERSWSEVQPFETPYRPAVVRNITDGDTFTLMLDLGFDVAGVTAEVRLLGFHCGIVDKRLGVDAFEPTLRSDQTEEMKARGQKATELCQQMMPPGTPVLIRSRIGGERGQLNRWLALVLIPTDRMLPVHETRWVSMGDLLLQRGLARVWWRGWRQGRPRPDASDPKPGS